MKLVFITREDYHLSGARIRCHAFARELAKYGVNSVVFSFAERLGAKCGEKEFEMSNIDKLSYNFRAFRKLIKEEKGSIFYLQRLNYHTLSPFLVSLLRGHKLIFDCDDWNIRENPRYYLGFMPSSKMEFLTRKLAGYADICIVASNFLKEYLSRFNKRIYYIPTGVDVEYFKPRGERLKGNNIIRICWIGTAYHKDIHLNLKAILDIFVLLAHRYKNIFLHLAGEGKYLGEIEKEVARSFFRDRIYLDGWIQPEKMPDYLDNIDIGLLPLFEDSKFNQAKSPTKLFEYMAMAKPTVASSIGEAPFIVDDGQNGLLARTKEEFAEKLSQLISDPLLCRRLGDAARQTVSKKYSLEILGRRLYEAIKDINA